LSKIVKSEGSKMKWMVIVLLICSLKDPAPGMGVQGKETLKIGGSPLEYAELFKNLTNLEEDVAV
jgi:hypothetical protein